MLFKELEVVSGIFIDYKINVQIEEWERNTLNCIQATMTISP
jgi:hypothetical protein